MQTWFRSRASGVLGVSLVALALAACGSSGESKQDFIARANGICTNAIHDVRNVSVPGSGGAVSAPALAKYLEAVAPIVASEAKQLRALPRPTTDRALLEKYLAAVAAIAAQYKALARAARAGDRQAMSTATAALQANPATGLATRYGLTECAGATGTVQTSR
jgi:hypothetical protein